GKGFLAVPGGAVENPASPQPAWSRTPFEHCIVTCHDVHGINPSYPPHKITFLVKAPMRHRKSMSWTWKQPPVSLQWLAADAHGHPLYAPGEKAGTKMKNHAPLGVAIVLASLLLVSPGLAQEQAAASPPTNPPSNDAIVHHMEELEEQVKELRAEVATLKGSDKPATPPAPVPAQSNLVNSAAAPGAAPLAPSLAGLLGPTTLSGFVDVYYGQNFNNPASQTNGLRFFDAPTNQFGLNLVELVVDKTPDA